MISLNTQSVETAPHLEDEEVAGGRSRGGGLPRKLATSPESCDSAEFFEAMASQSGCQLVERDTSSTTRMRFAPTPTNSRSGWRLHQRGGPGVRRKPRDLIARPVDVPRGEETGAHRPGRILDEVRRRRHHPPRGHDVSIVMSDFEAPYLKLALTLPQESCFTAVVAPLQSPLWQGTSSPSTKLSAKPSWAHVRSSAQKRTVDGART